jgi:N-acetylmuramoyl-L-alanine amidase
VIIDPGHGGKDPGAIGIRGIQEKQIVMTISLEVARILEQQGIQVRMTRNSDYFISLEGRTDMANRLNADIFVSIHANSAGSNKPQVNGLETYYFQSGRNLAAMIHRNVLSRVDVNDRKVRQARFYVLRKSEMPSVLVETGFVTGSEDSAKLSNPSYQKQMAAAIAAGIIEYIRTNRL